MLSGGKCYDTSLRGETDGEGHWKAGQNPATHHVFSSPDETTDNVRRFGLIPLRFRMKPRLPNLEVPLYQTQREEAHPLCDRMSKNRHPRDSSPFTSSHHDIIWTLACSTVTISTESNRIESNVNGHMHNVQGAT